MFGKFGTLPLDVASSAEVQQDYRIFSERIDVRSRVPFASSH